MQAKAADTLLIVAAEASGDLHGAKLMEALRRRRPGLRFVGMGGPAMRAAGLEVLYRAEELSVMGIVEVLPKLARILQILGALGRWGQETRPAGAILIDSADFNLRLARKLREVGIPTVSYIAPMAWAWREGRTKALRDLDRVLCILPFEEPWFRARRVRATFVGNPLLEEPRLRELPDRAACRASLGLDPDRPTLAILPGSRRSEVQMLLPTLLEAADALQRLRPELQVVLPVAPTLERSWIDELVGEGRGCAPILVEGRSLEAMSAADAVVLCSGTATLEAALLGRPMVVVYRANQLSWKIFLRMVRVKYASIVNLLAEREIVPELLQENFERDRIVRALQPLLEDSEPRARMVEELARIASVLGERVASERAAQEILDAVFAGGGELSMGEEGAAAGPSAAGGGGPIPDAAGTLEGQAAATATSRSLLDPPPPV